MVAIGVEDVSGELVLLDLDRSNMLVVGGARTGKSTALSTIAVGMARDREVHLVTADAGGMAVAGATTTIGGDAPAIARSLDDLTARLRGAPQRPAVVVVDDLDLLDDTALTDAWSRLAAVPGLRLVASVGAGRDARLLHQPDHQHAASGALHVAAPARRPGRAGAVRR